ncbi:MAG: AMP-binding protein, partial [Oryzihumus sp.]
MTLTDHSPWAEARTHLDGLPGGRGLNIAHEAVDRHVLHGRGDVVALRCLAEDGSVTSYTYADLRRATNRFARVLDTLGVGRGETVVTLLGRGAETVVTALGTLKHTSVFCPLFAAFGPEPVRERMTLGRARVLVTTTELYRRRVQAQRDRLPDLEHVLLVDSDPGARIPGTRSYRALLDAASDEYDVPATDPETPALL